MERRPQKQPSARLTKMRKLLALLFLLGSPALALQIGGGVFGGTGGNGTASGGGSTNGTIVASPQGQLARYSAAGTTTTVAGDPNITDDGTTITVLEPLAVASTITATALILNGDGENPYFLKPGYSQHFQVIGSSTGIIAGQCLRAISSDTVEGVTCGITANQAITVSGDATGTGTTGLALTMAAVQSNIRTIIASSVTFSGALVTGTSTYAPVLSSGTIIPNAALSNIFVIPLASNITLNGPLNGTNGQKVELRLVQDGSTRTVTMNGDYIFGTDITSLTFSGGGSKTDEVGVIWNSVKAKWEVVSKSFGF